LVVKGFLEAEKPGQPQRHKGHKAGRAAETNLGVLGALVVKVFLVGERPD
jgi:hypothetical protein